MPNPLEFILERLVLFAPSVLSLLGLSLILELLYLWRMAILQDRLFGFIAEDRKGELPLHHALLLAALQLWPLSHLPSIQQWWASWMDRKYGSEKKLTTDQGRQYVRRMYYTRQCVREIHWLENFLVLVLGPLREELLFRLPLLLMVPALTIWGVIFLLISAGYFGYIHWSQHAAFIYEKLMSWVEERENTTKRQQRITAVCMTFALGLLCGSAVIYYQNLWVAVTIHSIWNYAMPKLYTICTAYWLHYTKGNEAYINWRKVWKI